jgi:2-iminobutanoate/2-iminopropanoate deaminase
MREPLQVKGAPQAIGPYSQAIRVDRLLFISGQVPLDPATGQMVEGDIAAQTERVMENLGAILEAAGLDFSHVAKATIYLADLGDFAKVNEVYARRFREAPPARSTVQVAGLPRGARVEIDFIALGP